MVVLTLTLVLAGFTGVAWGQEGSVLINGANLDMPKASLLNDNGHLLVPGDALAKVLGASFSQQENGDLLVQKAGRTLVFSGSTLVSDQKPISLAAGPRDIGGKWFIPLRVTAEMLNCTVEWNAVNHTASVWGSTVDVVALDILGINDFHGALEESGKDPGFAKLGSYLKEQHDQNPEGTLILSAGDMFQGSVFSTVLKGKPVAAAMNEIGFDAMALGNHDFDWNIKTLQERRGQAKFPFLAANVMDCKTGSQPEGIEPFVIVEKQGIKVGVIGLVTPETPEITNPEQIVGLEFNDPVTVLQTVIPQVRQQGAEVIVVLSHLGCIPSNGQLIGEAVELPMVGIDALLTGHSHQKLAGEIKGIPVVQAAYNGRSAASIRLLYSRGQNSVIKSLSNVTDLNPADMTEDPGIADVIKGYRSEVKFAEDEIIGKNLYTLNHDRYQVSPLGSWASDVIRQSTSGDIAFLNGGGLRTDLLAGNITLGQIMAIMPFDNNLVLQEMTGEDILKVLEYGINNQKYGSVQFSGLKVSYDVAKPAGQRVTAVTLSDNEPLAKDKSYQVVTNDFMAGGGDGYTMFKEAGTPQINTKKLLRNVVIDQIKRSGTVAFKDDQRLIKVK